MEQLVLTLSIRTHVLASRVILEHIARQVRVCDCQTSTHIMQYWIHFYLSSIWVGSAMKVHSEQKTRIKLDKVLRGESSIKSVWLMTFVNEGGHYEESLPNTNWPWWHMGWSISSIHRLHLCIRWNWTTRSYNEAYNGTLYFSIGLTFLIKLWMLFL